MTISEEVPAIEITGLVKLYNGFPAVDGLSIVVPQRCFFGFLGPNGAGKTTTIKMLMGLAQPDAGTIHVLGMPLPEKSLEIRREIGLVPDDSLLFDYLTGAEYLEFVGRLYGLPKPQAKERFMPRYLQTTLSAFWATRLTASPRLCRPPGNATLPQLSICRKL